MILLCNTKLTSDNVPILTEHPDQYPSSSYPTECFQIYYTSLNLYSLQLLIFTVKETEAHQIDLHKIIQHLWSSGPKIFFN